MVRRSIRQVVVEREEESEEQSSEEEEDDDDHEEEESDEEEEEEEEQEVEAPKPIKRKPITISLKNSKICKVCKGSDHQAGFVGSVYIDCPNRPCFLCKQPGHTTATCPHKGNLEETSAPAQKRLSGSFLDILHGRQLHGRRTQVKRMPPIPSKVDSAILKLHSRRVTSLEFHPTKDNIILSGDKKGQIGIWDYEKVFERTVHETVHSCLVNSIRFHTDADGIVFTSSSDGTVCCTDLELGVPESLLNLNPDGWQGPATWRMVYGMDVNVGRNLVMAGDDAGKLHLLDRRSKTKVAKPRLIHKSGTKVVALHCNPLDPDLFLSSGNDHYALLWDMRTLSDESKPLASLPHPRVVNSAYFSPVTGSKILSTCQDNRVRVWDYIYSDLSQPSREIVHSHDFNRYLTGFRAEWDPKDTRESLIVIGRYISDDFDGVALHPIDFIDASSGQLVAEVRDPNLTTICPVNKLHPRLDLMVTGSSRSLYVWRPLTEEEIEEEKAVREVERVAKEIMICHADGGEFGGKRGGGKGKKRGLDDDDDDDEKFTRVEVVQGKKASANGKAAGKRTANGDSKKKK